MNTFLGITSTISKMQVDPEAIRHSKFMYMEGYLVASPSGREAAIHARRIAEAAGVKTALTFSDVNMVRFFRDGLREMLGDGIDLLFCNEAEAFAFTDTDDVIVASERLKQIAKTFVITRGENGAMIYDGESFLSIDPYPVKAVDSNGAGDMYAGAFLYAITHNHSFDSAGKLASLAASRVVSQFGPRLKREVSLEIKNKVLG
jgi:fructokinase